MKQHYDHINIRLPERWVEDLKVIAYIESAGGKKVSYLDLIREAVEKTYFGERQTAATGEVSDVSNLGEVKDAPLGEMRDA
jgi:hypothetical protein